MKIRLSIRARLTLWFGTVSFCGVLVLGTVACLGLRSTMNKVVDGELASRMEGVKSFLTEHVNRLPTARVQTELAGHAALKPAFALVLNPDGGVLFCGASVGPLCGTSAALERRTAAPFLTEDNLRVLSGTHIIKGATYRIRLASDLSFQTATLRRFALWLLLAAPLAMLALTLGGYLLSGQALRPVSEIIEAVHRIGEDSLSLRLQVPATGDEIQQLSETLNGMLGRIECAFHRVTELTANASHELRTPISIIRAAAEIALLNARPTLETQRQALLQICVEAEKNTRLLENMLLLARSDSDARTRPFTAVPIEKSVRQAVNACRHLAEAKDIAMTFAGDGSERCVAADASNLNRLWFLLLENAVKYTPPGGTVTAVLRTTSPGPVIVEVVDTGIGIRPEDRPRIFDRFFRAENARLASDSGSGLGLAIAHRIAEVHRAAIEVESCPSLGSTFRVTFSTEPAVQAASTVAGKAPRSLIAAIR